ncbi:MAG: efflux RND transporter periplasmic adaptor subunit [Candidatus Aminicenantes bacterium]|jgi:cobalt-zinc-cadmium efflux system membrane fusion protein
MKKIIILISIVILVVYGCGKQDASVPEDAHDHEQQAGEKTHDPEGEAGEHTHDPGEEPHTHEGEESPPHAHEGEEHMHLDISPEKQKEWGIMTGSPLLQNISSQITLPGSLSLDNNRTAHITSFVHGQISDLSVDLGTTVRRGQMLVTINSPDFGKAQADFLQARAALNLSQQEYDRAKMLLEEKAIEEKEYLRRKAAYEKLSTEYGALGSALHSYGITHEQIDELIAKCDALEKEKYKCEIADPHLPLLSPIRGTVIFRDAIVGTHIEPEKILFTVSDLSTLWAILDAYEKDIPYISKESRVYILSPLYPDKKFPGTISYIGETIDPKLRTVKIRAEIPNKEGLLKPNMYIQGVLENQAQGEEILTVPEEAIQNMDGKKVVFVVESKGVFAARTVAIGNKIGHRRIIREGLKPEDYLVLKGAFTIKTELKKGTFAHQHVH